MFTPVSISTAKDVQLHVYGDASEIATVGYLKVCVDGDSHVGFVMGRAKLAPTQGHTIPRLELCAAVLAVEVGEVISETLNIPLENVRYHSDSRVVLGYINNKTRRFYTYVANRVERILRSSQPTQWSYVPTQENPADQATRSSARHDNFGLSMWLCGPKRLWKGHELISSNVHPLVEPNEDKDIRPEVSVTSRKTTVEDNFCERFQKILSWSKLINIVSLIKREVRRFKQRKDSKTGNDIQMCPTLFKDSEVVVIKQVQKLDFSEEISCLEEGKQIDRSSSIKNLDPYLDDRGILRVGGRLNGSGLPVEETNPLILPSKHHVSRLVVQHYHEGVHHQGRLITEGSLRNNGYWIIGAKRLVSSVINSCFTCRKLRGHLEHQNSYQVHPSHLLGLMPLALGLLSPEEQEEVPLTRSDGLFYLPA